MTILIHTDEYYPTAQACAYRMQVLADAFVKQNNEVTVIASSSNLGEDFSSERNEKILYAPTIKMVKKTTIMRLLNNLSFAVSSVFTSFKVGKVDFVITTSPPPLISISGWIIAKLKGAKLIYDVRDIWPDVAIEMGSFSNQSVYSKVFNFIADFMYKHADLITTVSPGKVQRIEAHLERIQSKQKVKLVANGFDEGILNNTIDEFLAKKYQLNEKFTCVYIGNIGLAQGLGCLLDVAEKTKHKDVQFLIFGKGAERENLEKDAKDRSLKNIHFCGILPHEKVFTILSKAKVSFIPLKSSNMKDSVPTKIYEALGIGCPVLLVAEGDSCAIVNESLLGKCVSPDNLSVLPKAFDDMIENYAVYDAHKLNAKKLMLEKYSRQQIALQFEKELHEY